MAAPSAAQSIEDIKKAALAFLAERAQQISMADLARFVRTFDRQTALAIIAEWRERGEYLLAMFAGFFVSEWSSATALLFRVETRSTIFCKRYPTTSKCIPRQRRSSGPASWDSA